MMQHATAVTKLPKSCVGLFISGSGMERLCELGEVWELQLELFSVALGWRGIERRGLWLQMDC